MSKSLKSALPYLLILIGSVFLYLSALGKTPVHLNQDELMFSLNAKTIAESGMDYYGNKFPFYFWHLGSFWATPVIVYLDSIFLNFLPLSEETIRVGSVFVALLSIGLTMFLVQKIFKRKLLTLLAGFLTATTPALFINSRLLLDNVYPIPFVLLWLIFLYHYIKTKNPLMFFVSGLSLGAGIHSYHAAKIMMPVYLVLSCLIFLPEFKKNFKAIGLFIFGFLVPIIIFLPWLKIHPDTLLNQVSYIGSLDSTVEVQKGLLGVFNFRRLGDFASNYFTYFSPKILFISGDRSLIHSTRKVGAFLFPVVFLLVFGILETLRNKDKFLKLLLVGFLTYPIGPALVNDPERISRGFVVIPFVILLSIYGIKFLISQRDKVFRYLVSFVVMVSVFQFFGFTLDYFGAYRERSYAWFNNDIGGVLESSLKSTEIRGVNKIFLDEHIPFVNLYFEFYQRKLGIDAKDKWGFYNFNEQDFSRFPKGSLVVVRRDHIDKPLDKIDQFEKIETIRELDGNETFYIYYRDR